MIKVMSHRFNVCDKYSSGYQDLQTLRFYRDLMIVETAAIRPTKNFNDFPKLDPYI